MADGKTKTEPCTSHMTCKPPHTCTQTPSCVWEKHFPLHLFLSQRETLLLSEVFCPPVLTLLISHCTNQETPWSTLNPGLLLNNLVRENKSWLPANPGGRLPYKKDGGFSSYLKGVEKTVLVPLSVFSHKRSTAGAFVIPFKTLSWRNMTGDKVLCKNWYLKF